MHICDLVKGLERFKEENLLSKVEVQMFHNGTGQINGDGEVFCEFDSIIELVAFLEERETEVVKNSPTIPNGVQLELF